MTGTVFTKDSMARWLEENARAQNNLPTFGQLYGGIDYAGQVQLAELEKSYSRGLIDVYKQGQQQQSDIMASNLGQGYKQEALSQNDAILNEAYNSYIKNYLSDKQTIESNISNAKQSVTNELYNQGEMMSRYAQAHFNYLQDVYNKWQEGDLDVDLTKDMAWSKFLEQETDEEGNLIDSWKLMNLNKLRENMIDDKGYLTSVGMDFFNQMENDFSSKGMYSLREFLESDDKNEDLLDWLTSGNLYSYGDTGASLFRTAAGLVPDDQMYTFIENKFGMTEGQLDEEFETLNSLHDQIIDAIDNDAREKTIKKLTEQYLDEYKKLAESMGISDFDEFLKDQGTSYDQLVEDVTNNPYRNSWSYGSEPMNIFDSFFISREEAERIEDEESVYNIIKGPTKKARNDATVRYDEYIQRAKDSFNRSLAYLLNYAKK